MKYIVPVFICFLLWISGAQAQQTIYLQAGRIEFEKKVNIYARMNGENEEWTNLLKKTTGQFRTTYHNLQFNNDTLLYQPGRASDNGGGPMMALPGEENIVFTDLGKSQVVASKNIYDERFLVKDSTRKIQWKITSETRNIAGFECRRANALIMDSIYVVAFYTDAIIPSGGPETFNGLPGMILGVAMPHEHITWFATKVYAEEVKPVKAPVKGKEVTNKTMLEELQKLMKNWGKYGQRNIVAAML